MALLIQAADHEVNANSPLAGLIWSNRLVDVNLEVLAIGRVDCQGNVPYGCISVQGGDNHWSLVESIFGDVNSGRNVNS